MSNLVQQLIALAWEEGVALSPAQAEDFLAANQGKLSHKLLKQVLNQPRPPLVLSSDPQVRAEQLLRQTQIAVFHLCNQYIGLHTISEKTNRIAVMAQAEADVPAVLERIGKDLDEDNFSKFLSELNPIFQPILKPIFQPILKPIRQSKAEREAELKEFPKLKQLKRIYTYWLCQYLGDALFLHLEHQAIALGLPPTEFCTKDEREDYKFKRKLGQLMSAEAYAAQLTPQALMPLWMQPGQVRRSKSKPHPNQGKT